MREIKFRAWDKLLNCYTKNSMDVGYDNNGEEIYEGDIVKRYDTDKGQEIIWHNELSCFEFKEITSFIFNFAMARIDFEVIGNIHGEINGRY